MSACSSLETVSWNRIAFKRRPIAQMRRGYELSAVNLRAVRCLIVQYRTSDVVNLWYAHAEGRRGSHCAPLLLWTLWHQSFVGRLRYAAIRF